MNTPSTAITFEHNTYWTHPREYPKVRLALGGHSKNAQAAVSGWEQRGYKKPHVLVSYAYYSKGFEEHRDKYEFSDWSLDSGAFTACSSGKPIDLVQFMEFCKEKMAFDHQLEEIFALDVIGDWKGSLKNTEIMWKNGIPAIPVYHAGEPWSLLKELADTYPKIAIAASNAIRGSKAKVEYCRQAFARIWPCRVHGLAIVNPPSLHACPFHSVDASTWMMQAQGFGQWKAFGKLPHRGTANLGTQVEYFLKVQNEIQQKWKKEMDLLSTLPMTRRK